MRKIRLLKSLPALTVLLVLLAGCGFITGTFVLALKLVENEDLVWSGQYYYDAVDFADDDTWEEHGDKLQFIDMIGFELWATNRLDVEQTYDLYVAPLGSPLNGGSTLAAVVAGALPVLVDVPVPLLPEGEVGHPVQAITFGESFSYLTNADSLNTLAETGQFKLWLVPSTADEGNLYVDTLTVIVTFTAEY